MPQLLFLMLLVSSWIWTKANAGERGSINCLGSPPNIVKIGAVIDFTSRLGKEQKIAMEIAVQDVNRLTSSKLVLKFHNSGGNPATAVSTVVDLAKRKEVEAVIGSQLNEASLVSKIDKASKNLPIISLTASQELKPFQLPYFIQMANDISLHLQCIAAIVGHFRWRKVTAIYQHSNNGNGLPSSNFPEILSHLSSFLRIVNSDIDEHLAFPSLASLLDLEAIIEEKLRNVESKSDNRVFLIIQSSLEFATLLFEKANQMGLMEKGSVWIIPDDVASHLDSVDASVYLNMQGVIGCKSNFIDTSHKFKQLKLKFRRKFALKYPKEETPQPNMFALRAYDTIHAISIAVMKSQGRCLEEELSKNILSSDFEGLSGKISFRNRELQELTSFKIVNVFGKGYKEVAYWSPTFGFSASGNKTRDKTTSGNDSAGVVGPMNWPGGLQTVPRGFVYGNKDKPLKIGVPANGACSQLLSVSYDHQRQNQSHVSGFSIDVFNAALGRLPYNLHFYFVPFNGTYEDLIRQDFHGAVGDIEIISQRYEYVQFTHPYDEIISQRYEYVQFTHPYDDSGIAMIVRVKADRSKETWMFMLAFTKEMWLLMAAMHLFISFSVWVIEDGDNSELRGLGAMLWFSVTMLFFAHREPVRGNLARLVLAPWLFVILIVTSSFTASLTSMITVSQLEPSVPDIQTLQRTNAIVGCNRRSFMVNYLIDELKFKSENIRKFDSIADYPRAFENKEIAAAFLIAPQAQVFLATYCKGYVQAGSTLKLGGLAFAFPKSATSSLAIDMSEAILKVIECRLVEELKKDMLSSTNCATSNEKLQEQQLGPRPFFGLFYISGGTAILGLSITLVPCVGKKVHKLMSRVEAALLLRIGSMRSKLIPRTNSTGSDGDGETTHNHQTLATNTVDSIQH
ncbi:glutamate receptor 2.7-like [Senna tora]|uniref:Glutamate receptor n=1 Tax=Senna tora TaxID=362788 RepID=A0A834T9A0_9FABA|nr:glutamate receptor 2.7-like [Senna tora]